MKISKASIALLIIQMVLVCSIAAKYLYERSACPRVWTQAAMYDPSLFMRGRYLSMQLTVDACQSTLPPAAQAKFPRDVNGVPHATSYSVAGPQSVQFEATLAVKNNKLVAVRVPETKDVPTAQNVSAQGGSNCDQMRLSDPVDFYLAKHAQSPLPLSKGQELWVEVTVPPKGPPRPLQLALKEAGGAWKPLAFQ